MSAVWHQKFVEKMDGSCPRCPPVKMNRLLFGPPVDCGIRREQQISLASSQDVATEVFQFLQLLRDWLLA